MQELDASKLMDLHECVINGLKYLSGKKLPSLDFLNEYSRLFGVGSGNAEVTLRILLECSDAVIADESEYKKKLDIAKGIDTAILLSASGGKHAHIIGKDLNERDFEAYLFTCNPNALAREYFDEEKVSVFPSTKELYTYNFITYVSMILTKTKEDPGQILKYIMTEVDPLIPGTLGKYKAFYLIVPNRFNNIRDMFITKFDELFGSKISKRVFTPEQSKHAKTVVPSDEMFISLGYDNQLFGNEDVRLNIPLPENAGYAAMMAIGYYVIGNIQAQKPPWFKENLVPYCKWASEVFGHKIEPIVKYV